MTQNVTIFQNIRETDTPFFRDVHIILDRIKDGVGATKELVKKIRLEKRKPERQELKKQLPAICFSGTFNKRTDASYNSAFRIICLDFDGYESKRNYCKTKRVYLKINMYSLCSFRHQEMDLKVLVKIPADAESHTLYFNSLDKYFNSPYFDKTSKNISRVCYESYDPLIAVNENSSIWDVIEEPEYTEVSRSKDKATIPITDENKIVEILVKWWEKKYPMSEGQRNQNAYVLAMAFNDFGINKSLASYVLNQFASEDFTLREIGTTIDSAYRQVANFGTKYYEDEERINSIKAKLRRGVSKKEIRIQLQDSNLDSDTIESVLNKVEEEKCDANLLGQERQRSH
jgi:hypothetical protein